MLDKIILKLKRKLHESVWWNSKLARRIVPRSEFAKNVAVLSGGTAVAQVVGIITTPVFSRLYSPQDFGVFALFVSISGMLRVIASGRYELAVPLPKKDKEAINLVFLGSLISCLVGLFSLAGVLLFSNSIAPLLGEHRIAGLLIFVPLDILIYGIYNSLSYWCNRKKFYRIMSLETLLRAVTQAGLRLGLFFVVPDERGLVYSFIGGYVISFLYLALRSWENFDFGLVDLAEVKAVARKYIKFPTFSTLSALINTLSHQLTSITMPKLFDTSSLGYYSQANSIMGIPLALISNSMGKVFFQEASEEKNKTGGAEKTFNKTLKRLTMVSLPLFILIFIFIRPLATIFLGKQWVETGRYAQILVPLYAIRFVSSALSVAVPVSGKMHLAFIRDLFLFIGAAVAILMVNIFELTLIYYLGFISIILGLQYLGIILVYKKISRAA